MMAGRGKIRLAPNGNGAFLDVLGKSQKLQGLFKTLSYVQIVGVDNLLNKVLDPVQVGYTASKNLTCSFKSCLKRDSREKVGVICEKNGAYNVIEYTELPANLANQVAKDGQLKFKLGHILVMMVRSDFLLKLVTLDANHSSNQLYHKAFKKIEHQNPETWEDMDASTENGWKFELFIHSFLPKVEQGRLGVMIVDREQEFAPVKDADSPNGQILKDTPSMAKQMYLTQSTNWLKSVTGLKVAPGAQIEISPLLSYAGENLNWLKHVHKGKGLQGPGGYLDH